MPRMTQTEADAHQARVMMGRGHSAYMGHSQSATVVTATVERESELHQQIKTECNRRGWLCFSGAMHKRTWRTNGEPDLCILGRFGAVLWVEAKTRTGRLSDDQINVREKMASLGHTVHVVRSFREFLEIIK